MNKCFFCHPDETKEVFVYRGQTLRSFLEPCPVSPGHTLVFPKRHIISFHELNNEEWLELKNAIEESVTILKTLNLQEKYKDMIKYFNTDIHRKFISESLENPNLKLQPTAYNIGINDGYDSGKTVEHLHWHIIPRFKGDVEDPTGGVRAVIPGMENYHQAPK